LKPGLLGIKVNIVPKEATFPDRTQIIFSEKAAAVEEVKEEPTSEEAEA